MPSNDRCVKCADKYNWIGLFSSLFLAFFKGAIGAVTRSRALVLSAVYSFHDVISSVALMVGVEIATSPKDEHHPYGYGKMEYVITLFTSLIILGATFFLMAEAAAGILHGDHPSPHWAVFGIAFVSFAANETLYRFNNCAYRQLYSPAMMTHAKHHRADGISSLAVMLAVVGAKMGFHFIDTVVAVFECVHLIVLSGELLHHSGSELLDRAIDKKDIASILRIAREVTGRDSARHVRTRRLGRELFIELNLGLSGDVSLIEARKISSRLERVLMQRIAHVGSVHVLYE